jgi:hypothetical protein
MNTPDLVDHKHREESPEPRNRADSADVRIARAQGADHTVTLCITPAKSVEERQFPVEQLPLPGREVDRPQPGQAGQRDR